MAIVVPALASGAELPTAAASGEESGAIGGATFAAAVLRLPGRQFEAAVAVRLNRPLDDLRDMLLTSYAGKRTTMRQIYEEHCGDRPYTDVNYKTVLRALEDEDGLVAIFPKVT